MTLPDMPPAPFKAAGQEVILVSYSRGKVSSTAGFEIIKQLPSFVYLETGVRVGTKVTQTVDLFTGIGSVILMHPDKAILERDIQKIRQMEKANLLFEYEMHAEFMSKPSQRRGHRRVYTTDREWVF
jgi:hypothetical protein